MPDKEKYIEILSKAAKTVKEFNEDVPIKISLECVEDILELLKEQPEIVKVQGLRSQREGRKVCACCNCSRKGLSAFYARQSWRVVLR